MGSLVERFGPALVKAAAKAGVSLAGTTWSWETLANNWGAKMGFVFQGPQAERAAKFCHAWLKKNVKGSYECQNSVGPPELTEVAPNKANKCLFVGNRTLVWGAEKLTWTQAFAVPALYFPCAE